MDTPFTFNLQWHDKIGRIYALLERAKIADEQAENLLHLPYFDCSGNDSD